MCKLTTPTLSYTDNGHLSTHILHCKCSNFTLMFQSTLNDSLIKIDKINPIQYFYMSSIVRIHNHPSDWTWSTIESTHSLSSTLTYTSNLMPRLYINALTVGHCSYFLQFSLSLSRTLLLIIIFGRLRTNVRCLRAPNNCAANPTFDRWVFVYKHTNNLHYG